jgi:hypothetical protein
MIASDSMGRVVLVPIAEGIDYEKNRDHKPVVADCRSLFGANAPTSKRNAQRR